MENSTMKKLRKLVSKYFSDSAALKITEEAKREFLTLCEANANETKAVKSHTAAKIYPAISYYRALQDSGLSKEDAYAFMDYAFSFMAKPQADSMRMLLKIPGLYKLMPKMWKLVTKKNFGEDAGFRFKFYDVGKDRVKFDMQRCPYCLVCAKYGCPELTTIFCHTDDVCNENAHPLLKWNRSKTMGDGFDVCDFDVIVMKKHS